MANWTDTTLKVVLPTDRKDKFLSYFNSDVRFFARTGIDSYDTEESSDGKITTLTIHCSCAWSCDSCWSEDGYVADTVTGGAISMYQAVKECDVIKLIAQSIEPGVGIEELVTYGYGDSAVYFESRDWWDCDMENTYPDDFVDELSNIYADRKMKEEKAKRNKGKKIPPTDPKKKLYVNPDSLNKQNIYTK